MARGAVAVRKKIKSPGGQSRPSPPLTVEMVRLWPRQGEWTEEDYFALPATHQLVELSGQELIMPSPPSDAHQSASLNLTSALHGFVRAHRLGTIRYAPLPVRLWPGKIREPDILFVAAEHADRRGEQYYGPPDLVVEIISPGTERLDRQQKFVEYAQDRSCCRGSRWPWTTCLRESEIERGRTGESVESIDHRRSRFYRQQLDPSAGG